MTPFKLAAKVLPFKPTDAKRLLFVSDVHLEHPTTPTGYVINNLNEHVTNAAVFRTIDGLIIPGDLFDRITNLSADGMSAIHQWIFNLLDLSKRYNVPIRILAGTPSHDRGQARTIIDINNFRDFKADVRFYDGCQVIEDDALGLVIGYIQDEFTDSYISAQGKMATLLKTKGYSKVDIFVLHGLFDFQLPIVDKNTYNSDWFKDHARLATVIGHDHIPKENGNIYVPGSFDRTKQNEDHPKGYLLMDIYNSNIKVHRIINTSAMPYKTLRHDSGNDLQFIEQLELLASELTHGFIRIQLPNDTILLPKVKEWKAHYHHLTIKHELFNDSDVIEVLDENFNLNNTVVNITKDNVLQVILDELEESECAELVKEIGIIKSNI